MLFQCAICTKNFKHKRSLLPHISKVHGDHLPSTSKKAKSKIMCAICENSFSQNDAYRFHLIEYHTISLEEKEFNFSTEAEFQKWKKTIENEQLCRYVLTVKQTKSGGSRSFFACHRSGFYQSKSEGLREMKSIGTNKINATCPSTMVVTKREESVHVVFWSTHVGHGSNLGRCYLTKEERTAIAEKISAGVTVDKILNDIRDAVKNINDPIVLTTKQYLRNIKQKFRIFDGREHVSDAISLQLWVNRMLQLDKSENPVLLYKPQGDSSFGSTDDFLLIIATDFQKKMLQEFGGEKICIDSTHGTNCYDFHLTTLMVIDEFGAGYPCAFCFSNKRDTETWTVFFQQIKIHVGTINANIFMSDDDQSFYNAWKTIMGPVLYHLICSWHIDQAWRKNINLKIKGIEKKAFAYKIVKTIQQEADPEKFERLLKSATAQLIADPATTDFGVYFNSFYSDRASMWALCYRKGCGINTNMHLESLHKCLKHFYLQGKKNKRLDKCVNVLLKLTRDKLFERFNKLVKNKISKRKEIGQRHASAMEIDSTLLIQINDDAWEIPSSSRQFTYEVHKINEDCGVCPMRCISCFACMHRYQCSCPDYVIKSILCKHIHAVAMIDMADYQPDNSVLTSREKIEEVQNAIVVAKNVETDQEKLLKVLMNKSQTLPIILSSSSSSEYTVEHLERMNRTMDALLSLAANEKTKGLSGTQPANKNIVKQNRFYSTKKKRTTSNVHSSLSVPTTSQRSSIIDNLLNPNEESLYIHTAFDHSYALE